jgi:hypothetical protein
VDRLDLGEAVQHLDEVAALELFPRRGHEHHERLPGVPSLADDEVAEIAAVVGLVVGDETFLARPLANRVADRIAEIGGQPALLDLEHLVPTSRLVEPERRPGRRLRERVLELVPVEERRVGGEDLVERRLRDPADPLQRIADLVVLGRDLHRVVEILEAAAAAGRVVSARRLDALRRRVEHLRHQRLGEPALHLRHARAYAIARQAPPDEDDEAVQARDPVPAVGERVDLELDLLVQLHRRGHRRRVVVRDRGG